MAIDAALRQRIAEDFPAFRWLLDVPEVGDLLGKAATEGWDITKLQAQLYATRWWRTTTETQRQAQTLRATDPASYQEKLAQQRNLIYQEASRLGVRLHPNEVKWLQVLATDNAWSTAQITKAVAEIVSSKPQRLAGGELAASIKDVNALVKSYAYGVTEKTKRDWAVKIASGSMTIDGIRSMLADGAKRRYGDNAALVSAIDQGMTVDEYMAPTAALIAQELELNADAIDWLNPTYNKVLRFTDPSSGTMRTMTDGEAVQWARSQGRWRDTGGGKELASQLVDGLTRKMGARA